MLPLGKEVPVQALLYGLLLPSGNDAAVALADRMAGSDQKFAQLMNQRAAELRLSCTHFASSYGLQKGNRSCPADLAALARLVMSKPQIAHIVNHRHVNISFPIKQGGLASQQADAAAAHIARRAGADIEAAPFQPVLRAILLTGETPDWGWFLLIPDVALAAVFAAGTALVIARISAHIPDTTALLPAHPDVALGRQSTLLNRTPLL